MLGTIEYVHNLIVNSGLIYYTLMISIFFLSLSLFLYFYKYNELSFTMFYIGLTFFYMFLVAINRSLAFQILYVYYAFLFLAYHLLFTFSKRFYLRTLIIIKQYLKGSEYFKLFLWSFAVFLPSLLFQNFIFVAIFTPLLGFALVISNFPLFFFLLGQWFWMCILIFFNKFKIHTNFLRKILMYFSRKACLHYIGNNSGARLTELGNRVGYPLIILVPSFFGFMIDLEVKTGHYAIDKMHKYAIDNPDSSHDQRNLVFKDSYYGYANSTMPGQLGCRLGWFKPAAPELIIPNYKSDFARKCEELQANTNKKNSKTIQNIQDIVDNLDNPYDD